MFANGHILVPVSPALPDGGVLVRTTRLVATRMKLVSLLFRSSEGGMIENTQDIKDGYAQNS